MKKLAPFLFGIFIAQCFEASAIVMLAPGTALPGQAYIDYGSQFAASAVAIKRISTANNGNFGFVSGVQIDERHVLTAAHAIDSATGFWPREYLAVTIGANLYQSSVDVGIRRMQIHPTYGGSFGTGIDLVIFEIQTPQSGRGISIRDSAVPNEHTLILAGYGQHALEGQPLQVLDGYLRSCSVISRDPSGLFDNSLYNSSEPYGSLPGKGANRDSGGGVYFNGELVGIMISSSGDTSSAGLTTYLDLTQQEVKAFIDSFRADSLSPKVTINIETTSAHLFLSGLVPARDYRIMRAPTLSGWQEAHRFTASSSTNTWSEPLSLGGRMFYRLEWNE